LQGFRNSCCGRGSSSSSSMHIDMRRSRLQQQFPTDGGPSHKEMGPLLIYITGAPQPMIDTCYKTTLHIKTQGGCHANKNKWGSVNMLCRYNKVPHKKQVKLTRPKEKKEK
jgi:hypothetical protein